jgi:hypothetical protein
LHWWVYWKLEKKSFSNLREWWAKIKIKSITIEASKKVNTTDDKIKALENITERTMNYFNVNDMTGKFFTD